MNAYAESLIARNDAINGKIARQVTIGRDTDTIKLTAKAKALIDKDRRIEARQAQGVDHFNCVIKRATIAEQTRIMEVKQTVCVWIVRVRNTFNGKVHSMRCKSVSAQGAKQSVRLALEAHYTIVDVQSAREGRLHA